MADADPNLSRNFDEATKLARPPSPYPENGGLFEDIPRWIWILFLGAWIIFFALMFVFFATSPGAMFMVVIANLFALVAFGLPMALGAQSNCSGTKCTGIIQTHTGPVSERAAGAQIALIPIAVVIGFVGFAILAM